MQWHVITMVCQYCVSPGSALHARELTQGHPCVSMACTVTVLPQVGVDVTSQAGDLGLRATGSTVAFPGFLAVWGDGGIDGSSGNRGPDEAQAAGDADNNSDDGGGGSGSTAATAAVISSLKVCHLSPRGHLFEKSLSVAACAWLALCRLGRQVAAHLSWNFMPRLPAEPGFSFHDEALLTFAAPGAGGAHRDEGGGRGARHGAAAAVHGGQPREGAPANMTCLGT